MILSFAIWGKKYLLIGKLKVRLVRVNRSKSEFEHCLTLTH